MILVGTSGYSYKDWVGPFYPPGTKEADYLAYYSDSFNAVEINFTYYRPPTSRVFARMVERSQGKVSFSVKAHQEMTHDRNCPEQLVANFKEALKPLQEAGVFLCLLAQFPYSFKKSKENFAYLSLLAQRLAPLEIVIEFRNNCWVEEETFEFLAREKLGYCCVDEPKLKGLMPGDSRCTSDTAYVRFHGRNKEKWWEHKLPAERYDYLYSQQELQEWLPKLRTLQGQAKRTLAFFNNHSDAKAAQNAKELRGLLEPEEI
jgi:uncharacterized protein YecE (DUF72 family)